MPSAGILPGEGFGTPSPRGVPTSPEFFWKDLAGRHQKLLARGITALLETPDQDAGPLDAWCKDAREQPGWFCSLVSQPKTPQRCTNRPAVGMQACKACRHKLGRHAFGFLAHPLLHPRLPTVQFPGQQGSSRQNPPETPSACNVPPVGGKPDLKFPSHLH